VSLYQLLQQITISSTSARRINSGLKAFRRLALFGDIFGANLKSSIAFVASPKNIMKNIQAEFIKSSCPNDIVPCVGARVALQHCPILRTGDFNTTYIPHPEVAKRRNFR